MRSGNEMGSGDAGPHAVVGIGSTLAFGYDDNGSRITKTDNTVVTGYSYDSENRLESVDLPSDADDVVFVYADGTRVSRSHGDYSTTYVGGVMEIDRTGTTVTETRTHYGIAGTPVAVRTHNTPATSFLFQNHLGSTVAAFNDATNAHIRQYYYPYGAERHNIGTLPVDQRYTGQTSDNTGANSGDTDLYFYNARYYDPAVGAFVAADSVVPTSTLSAGLNRYAYVADNPADHTDPNGEGWIQIQQYAVGDTPDRNPDVTFEAGRNPEAIAAINQAANEGRIIATGDFGTKVLPPTEPVEPDYGEMPTLGDLVASVVDMGAWMLDHRDTIARIGAVVGCAVQPEACGFFLLAAFGVGALQRIAEDGLEKETVGLLFLDAVITATTFGWYELGGREVIKGVIGKVVELVSCVLVTC